MGRNRQRERGREDDNGGCLPGPVRGAWGLGQILIALYGFLTVIYLLGRITVGETWNVIGHLNNGLPWLAFAAIALAVVALFSRYRGLLIALQLPIVIVFLVLYAPVLLPADPPEPGTGRTIRAASYNLLSGQSEAEAVADVIATLDADIIALHELGAEHAAAIEAAVADEYPHRVMEPVPDEARGAGLLSRFPILEQEAFTIGNESFIYLRAVLDVHGTPVVVYAAHPPPPENRVMPWAYNDTPRDEELRRLREDYLADEQGPVLLLCDCNMGDQSDIYQTLDALLDDAFWEAGQGLGFTFQSRLPFPFLRIDYVWHSDDFTPLGFEVGDDAGTSDHRPIVAELELGGEAP